ncbi:hypothetical protein [Micromonospora sp. ATA51]|uniref:hypothetical protein n=1 Tax=Micromonospora sp. ATA51 TaxID=2806098 RepID=UPI001EE45A35|nr:hypothetical protein [Micromonospora sp. ATA51]
MSHTLPLRGRRVLVSGAGVAGPALAWWLARYGAEVTVVELAPALRTSGFAVDFRGPTHLGVLAAMGVLDELRAGQTHAGAISCVDEHDREIFRLRPSSPGATWRSTAGTSPGSCTSTAPTGWSTCSGT